MVTETPSMTSDQQRLVVRERLNPIAFMIADEEVMEYGRPILWNYGFLPQTWADPEQVGLDTGLKGSGGPVEVIDVGSRQHEQGQVTAVGVLGALPMVDRGTLRWLVIAVDPNDPISAQLKPVAGNGPWAPQLLQAIRTWFGTYATYKGVVLDLATQEKAMEVVGAAHAAWQGLRSGGSAHLGLWAGTKEQRLQQSQQEERERQQRQYHQLQQGLQSRGQQSAAQAPIQGYMSHGQPQHQQHNQFAARGPFEGFLSDMQDQRQHPQRLGGAAPTRGRMSLQHPHQEEQQMRGVVGPPAGRWQRGAGEPSDAYASFQDRRQHRRDGGGHGQRRQREAPQVDEGFLRQFGARRPQHRPQPAEASTGFAGHDSDREAANKARSAALRKILLGARSPAEQQPTRRYQRYHDVQ